MKISIGCDHSALELKNNLIAYLKECGHEIIDRGTYDTQSCDYTDFGYQVAKDIKSKACDKGIVICFTGIGMSIIANKVRGVRCALVYNSDAALLTREHNDSNCLALSSKYTSFDQAKEITNIWLYTDFSFNERHQRRIDKITKYEEEE
ncbi:MAG: ribose 5-phosphate isomerase B [Acholeplasmatales bacterium]|nr:ribose 5-phosphate isomerase B [Acholeplasmatales bacterium]